MGGPFACQQAPFRGAHNQLQIWGRCPVRKRDFAVVGGGEGRDHRGKPQGGVTWQKELRAGSNTLPDLQQKKCRMALTRRKTAGAHPSGSDTENGSIWAAGPRVSAKFCRDDGTVRNNLLSLRGPTLPGESPPLDGVKAALGSTQS